MDAVTDHNPDCGTSRNTLGLIRNAGIEPHIIEYLKTPPTWLLPQQQGGFGNEDGERVVDKHEPRVASA
jgi:hypothetical protein